MALFPVAGKRIFIGGVLNDQASDFVASDFDSQTWVEIDGWETHGTLGDASELITSQLINRNRDVKQKGTRNSGSMQNNFVIVPDDPGQEALSLAEASSNNYAFKIEWPDAPTGGTPTQRLFIALVMGVPDQGGSANTVSAIQSTLELNSNIVPVAAAPAA